MWCFLSRFVEVKKEHLNYITINFKPEDKRLKNNRTVRGENLCQSPIGMRKDRPNNILFGSRCKDMTLAHEILHSLGKSNFSRFICQNLSCFPHFPGTLNLDWIYLSLLCNQISLNLCTVHQGALRCEKYPVNFKAAMRTVSSMASKRAHTW